MSDFDFQPYLSAIVDRYSQQRDLYTPTDALLLLEARSVEREEEGREKRAEQFPVLEGVRKYALGEEREHVLLAGRPGSGKSTALRQLVLELATDGLVPVLVQLKGDRTVPELIKAEFRRAKVAVTEPQIDEWLMHDRLVLLLDGVNEMPTEELRRSLAQFREDNRTVPMIFTTRDLSLGGDLGIEKRFEMRPLSPKQLREFVGTYLPEQGENLLGQLRDRLREIAETPLLLKMLCDVFRQTGEIPANKGELFRLFDREYEKFKGLPAVSADFRRFKSEVLQHLAYIMMLGDGGVDFELTIDRGDAERAIENLLKERVDSPGAKAKEWLENLVAHHLFQVAADGRRVEFHHQLFQEYYSAEWFLGRVREMDDERLECEFLNLLKWTEVLEFSLSLMKSRTRALKIVHQAFEIDLFLGAKLTRSIDNKSQIEILEDVINSNKPTMLKVMLLREIDCFSSIPYLMRFVTHQNSEIRDSAVYKLIQEWMGQPNVFAQLIECLEQEKALHENMYDCIQDLDEAIYIIDYQSFLKTIQMALMSPTEEVLDIALLTIGKLQLKEMQKELCRAVINQSLSQRVRTTALYGLENIRDEGFVDYLLAASKDLNPNVRIFAVAALGHYESLNAMNRVHEMLEDESFEVRTKANLILSNDAYDTCQSMIFNRSVIHGFPIDLEERINEFLLETGAEFGGFLEVMLSDEGLLWKQEVGQLSLGERFNDPTTVVQELIKLESVDAHDLESEELLLDVLWGFLICERDDKWDYLQLVRSLSSIKSIQSNCKFYNYEIHQKAQTRHPPGKQQNTLDTIATGINTINQRTKAMAEQQPTISISGGTFNGPVNLSPNQGHQPTTIIETQINYSTDPNLFQTIQNLLQQNIDLKTFITELETQNPNPQTEAEAEAVRDQAIVTLQNNNPSLWKTIRHQMRTLKRQILNPERHAQAAKATLVEVTKAYWEKSLIAKAIVTYIDKLSETPD